MDDKGVEGLYMNVGWRAERWTEKDWELVNARAYCGRGGYASLGFSMGFGKGPVVLQSIS